MTVTLTSPCMGKAVGETYTGDGETWLVAMGYAVNSASGDPEATGADIAYAAAFTPDPENDNQIDYSGTIGPDGLNTLADGGEAVAVLEADDLTNPDNRERPWWPANPIGDKFSIANDADNLTQATFPHEPNYDMGGVEDDAPGNLTFSPKSGIETGGTRVTISGDDLEGVTSVTFGGVAGTDLDVSNAASAGEIKVTTPAGTAGPADVVLVDPAGNTTLTAGWTYNAA